MAINKVGSKGIEDGSVASADFAPNTVTSAKLQDGAVTNAKLTNSSVTLTGSSVSLGGSVTFNNKFVDWQTVITAAGSSNTAVSGQGYFIDTTSDVHTVTLPASANRGDFIAIKDYAGTFGTNNLTIARNGHNIQGVANDSLISTNRASLVLVYVDSTKGWLYWEEHNVGDLGLPLEYIAATGGTVTTSGDYKIHTFTGDGCFVVSNIGNSPVNPLGGPDVVDYLVVAGGGGGGAGANSGNGVGGGGAGGYRESSGAASGCYTVSPLGSGVSGITVTATTYPVTVGGGGAGQPVPSTGPSAPGNGSNSVFSTITSTGGGAGGNRGDPNCAAQDGGSGGGATGGYLGGTSGAGGIGNTPPVSPPQGNSAGNNSPGSMGGGGGGATSSGTGGSGANPTGTAGVGGNGATSSINGTPTTRAGGGGGGAGGGGPAGVGGGGAGGPGGGGRGGDEDNTPSPAQAGTSNTGSGGGGGGGSDPGRDGANGGKGIIIIRYKFQ